MAARYAKIVTLIVFLTLAGCRKTEPTTTPVPPSVTPRPSLTPAPAATATSTATPTPSATATPSATPTPTALSLRVTGDPREVHLSTPFPQSGAPCGVVDWLDFPIDPPDADNAFGGGDFGVFRSNYNGYHAGEDWWGPQRSTTFGTPVHSIAHGTVTYAQPLGWGVDQGVVIVRHVFSDGSSVLSFYGHLDPPSVVLKVGACVARGDVVGRIGRPRRAPHLHFEIRHHMPDAPGPGYWSRDPRLAGWEAPSQYIWNKRITTSPGVLWARPFVALGTQGVGMLDDDTLVVIEDHQLIGINVLDGSTSWRQPGSIRVEDAAIDMDREVIYVADQLGRVEALRLTDAPDANAATPALVSLWQTRVAGTGFPTLMPLPRGGVVVSLRRQMSGLSPRGTLLWARENAPGVFDWALVGDRLLVSTLESEHPMWSVDRSGPRVGAAQVGGYLAVAGDQAWVYGVYGVYQLDLETLATELVYALPTALDRPERRRRVALAALVCRCAARPTGAPRETQRACVPRSTAPRQLVERAGSFCA
jgi:murein DD-endopeptidase MepM/ murein hydrolase activator NlpD